MKIPILTFSGLCLSALWLSAEDVSTEPIGFNKVTCLPNSDTIVGVPLRTQGSTRSVLGAPPSVSGDSATITLASSVLDPGALTGHYLIFIDGDRAGRWYDIQTSANNGTPNTASAVTITLNGDTIGNATTGNKVLIARYWTLDELFPPAGATTSWSGTPPVPNGHAIVATTSAFSRKTEILIPNYNGAGTNLSTTLTFYINAGSWKVIGTGAPSPPGKFVLYPDNYIIIRHNSTVPYATSFRCLGEVEVGKFSIPLTTRTSGKQDNYVAIPRPVPVTLAGLALSTEAFVTTTSAFNRKDELLVFNNELALKNKSASATYYRVIDSTSGLPSWRSTTTGTTPQDGAIIPAGAGLIIRKAATSTGATAMWQNTPSY